MPVNMEQLRIRQKCIRLFSYFYRDGMVHCRGPSQLTAITSLPAGSSQNVVTHTLRAGAGRNCETSASHQVIRLHYLIQNFH